MHVTAFASAYNFTALYFIMAYFAEMDKICHMVGNDSKLTYNKNLKIIFYTLFCTR